MKDFYYCRNCGFVSDDKDYCCACADENQILIGEFKGINEAYVYYHENIEPNLVINQINYSYKVYQK
jgi:hypothetical protein